MEGAEGPSLRWIVVAAVAALSGCGIPDPIQSNQSVVIPTGYRQQLYSFARMEIPPGQRLYAMNIRGRTEWCSRNAVIIPEPGTTGGPKAACFHDETATGRFRQAYIVAPLGIAGAWEVNVPYVLEGTP